MSEVTTTPSRGVTVAISGKQYRIQSSINGLCRVEEMESTPGHPAALRDIVARSQAGDIRSTRLLVWSGFLKHQPAITVDEVCDLIDEAGGLEQFLTLLSDAGSASTAQAKTSRRRKT